MMMCVGIGAFANSRGRDPIGWFVIAFLISPLLAGIILLVLADLAAAAAANAASHDAARVTAEQNARDFARQAQAAKAAEAAEEARRFEALKVSATDVLLTLERIRQLHEKRVYSDIEFMARKRKALEELSGKMPKEQPDDFLATLLPLYEIGALTPEELGAVKHWVHAAHAVALAAQSAPPPQTALAPRAADSAPQKPAGARTWSGFVCERCGTSAPVPMACEQCGTAMAPAS